MLYFSRWRRYVCSQTSILSSFIRYNSIWVSYQHLRLTFLAHQSLYLQPRMPPQPMPRFRLHKRPPQIHHPHMIQPPADHIFIFFIYLLQYQLQCFTQMFYSLGLDVLHAHIPYFTFPEEYIDIISYYICHFSISSIHYSFVF